MKKLVAIIISCIALAIGSSSCEDMMGSYLDKAPGIDVTEDTVFSSTAHAERFLATVYPTNSGRCRHPQSVMPS